MSQQPPSAADQARWHRWFAVECNNRAWQLADRASRTAAEDDEMLDAAHAAGDVIADSADRTILEATFARIPAP